MELSFPRRRDRLRRKAGSMVLTGFFRGISGIGRRTPWAKAERHGVEVIRDLPYTASAAPHHLLDVYRPMKFDGPLPVVLYIHGGGFRILSKETHWMFGLAFAKQNFVVFNINYRLAPEHPFPAAVEDCADAYRWVVENAHLFGGDPEQIFVAGESAGANLACDITIGACYEREEPYMKRVYETGVVPAATLPDCGFLESGRIERFVNSGAHRLIVDRMQEINEAYLSAYSPQADEAILASPLRFFERERKPDRPLPPFFIPCGTGDPLIDDSRRLTAALNKLGVSTESPEYAKEPHAFHALLWKESARRCMRDHFDFLDRQLAARKTARAA